MQIHHRHNQTTTKSLENESPPRNHQEHQMHNDSLHFVCFVHKDGKDGVIVV